MKLHHIALAAGAGWLWHQHEKQKRRRRKTPKTSPTTPHGGQVPSDPPPRATLEVAPDCSTWTMSDAWILQVAQPRFGDLLREHIRAQMTGTATESDPISMTYRVLEGEHPGCPVPLTTLEDGTLLRFDALQSDIPGTPDAYPHGAILGLYAHLTEAVIEALRRFETSGNPDELLFPL